MNKRYLIVVLAIVIVGGFIYFMPKATAPQTVGGDRDAHGCLAPAGYAYDEELGACARSWELTPDIKKAAKLAVDSIGQGYALTLTQFNSYEEQGSYDFTFEKGIERTLEKVVLKNWQVVDN